LRKKQQRYRDNAASPYVIEPGKEIYERIKGKWRCHYFENDHPVTLELACGRGEYTIGLGKVNPQSNYIGVDIKGSRIWKGSQLAAEHKLQNVAFLRTQIDHLDHFFERDEIDEIWIVHPDPRPKNSDERKRLTGHRFLEMYKHIMKPNGLVRLKTDNTDFFDWTLDILKKRPDVEALTVTRNLYQSELVDEHLGIQTRYERKFVEQGFLINYLRFRWK